MVRLLVPLPLTLVVMPLLPILAVADPKARVQAPSVSEDEDSAELIVPDGEGGASVGDK